MAAASGRATQTLPDAALVLRQVGGTARVSSIVAPLALAGGWTVGAARQVGGFDSIRGTISALAARDATDRWIMTAGIAVTGISHVCTALGLRDEVRIRGRVALALGGVATIGVAVAPLPTGTGSSVAHTIFAGAAFGLLSLWPALCVRRTAEAVHMFERRRAAFVVSGVLFGLVAWFTLALRADAAGGLAERIAALAQALWPAIVVHVLADRV